MSLHPLASIRAPLPSRFYVLRGCPESPLALLGGSLPEIALRKPRKLWWSWSPLWPSLPPSRSPSYSLEASCSCRGCEERCRKPSRLWELARSGASSKCGYRTRPRTQVASDQAVLPARASALVALHHARWLRGTFFERQLQSLKRPAHTGVGDLNTVNFFEEFAMLL